MILMQEGASRVNDRGLACGGTLTLTPVSLVFDPTSQTDTDCQRTLELSDIRDVVWFKTLNIIPNGFSLLLNNGMVESFIVLDKKRWKESIDTAKAVRPAVAI